MNRFAILCARHLAVVIACSAFLAGCAGTSGGSNSASATGKSGETNPTPAPSPTRSLASIAISPNNASIAKGTSQLLTATGTYKDGSTQNVTASVAWSSSDDSIAAINSTGLATGVTAGSTTIQASSGAVTGSAALTVTSAVVRSIAITPANPSVLNGAMQPFTAVGTFSDGSTQNLTNSSTWTSSDAAVSTINSAGIANAVNAGTSIIRAAVNGISGSTTLTVISTTSVTISPATATVQAGSGIQQFTATVPNDPQNNGVTWSLSGAGCSGGSCGTLSSLSSASGAAITYTAPPSAPAPDIVILTATSVSDPTRSSFATIAISFGATPVGSTFTESFSGAANSCWSGGPSLCDQLWIAQGSAQSIVPAPGSPPPNMAGSSSLQMAEPAGTANYIYTTGSFPRLPAGTPFDLYFTLDVTSQAMTAFDLTSLITPANNTDGQDYPAQISFSYDGSNLKLQAYGASSSSGENIALNAWHTVQLHLAAGTNASFITVDGGGPSTFTENPTDFAWLVIGSAHGEFDAITYDIGVVYVNSALGGGPPPSAYIDFETATDGTTVTPATLAASTHCGNGIWTLSTTPITGLTISSAGQKQLPAPVNTCGTQYIDTGTRGARYDISQTGRYASYTWSSTSASASVGFFYMITVSDNNFYSAFAITGSGFDYAVLHVLNGTMALETTGGLSSSFPISPNVWYWVTLQYNAGRMHRMQVYDTTTWTMIGNVSGPASGNYAPTAIEIGRPGSETGFPSAYWYYDNIIIDYLNAKFPLLPN